MSMPLLPSGLIISSGTLVLNGACIYHSDCHELGGVGSMWIDLASKLIVSNTVRVKILALIEEVQYLLPAEQQSAELRLAILCAAHDLVAGTYAETCTPTRYEFIEACKHLDRLAENYHFRSLLPLQLFRATSFLRPMRGVPEYKGSGDTYSGDVQRTWKKLTTKVVAIAELGTTLHLIDIMRPRFVIYETWNTSSSPMTKACPLLAAKNLLKSTISLHDIAGAYENIVRFSRCYDMRSTLSVNLIRNLRSLRSNVRELLVWQTCIEVPDALGNMEVFDNSVFKQILKPAFHDKETMWWEPRDGFTNDRDEMLDHSVSTYFDVHGFVTRKSTGSPLNEVYADLHMSFKKAMESANRHDSFRSRSDETRRGYKRPPRERDHGPVKKTVAHLHLRPSGGCHCVARVESIDNEADSKRRRSNFMTIRFISPLPICGSLGRLQGVRLNVDLDMFKRNWTGGASFIKAQQRALLYLNELTGDLLQPHDILESKRFLFDVGNAITMDENVDGMLNQMRMLTIKNTFVHIRDAGEALGTVCRSPTKNTFIHFDDEEEFDGIVQRALSSLNLGIAVESNEHAQT